MRGYHFDLEHALAAWRRSLSYNRPITADDLDELEQHVRDQVAGLMADGLDDERAFRQAMREMGGASTAEAEYGKVYWGKLKRRRALREELNQRLSMLKNYLKVAARNLRKQKGYSLINVIGLTLAIASALMIFQYVAFEYSFDRFHANASHLYRVQHDTFRPGGLDTQSAQTFGGLAGAMGETMPEVRQAAGFFLLEGSSSLSVMGDSSSSKPVVHNEQAIFFGDASLLTLFSFPMQTGSPTTALVHPNTVVLTARTAKKYFGDADPMGQRIRVRKNDSGLDATAEVTGVMEDLPSNSHLQFNFLFSSGTGWEAEAWSAPSNWERTDRYTYVELQPDVVPETIAGTLTRLTERYAGGNLARSETRTELSLQPIRDIHLYSMLQDEISPTGKGQTVWTLLGIGVLILVIGWVNYINLAMARMMSRTREVGLRKVVGAVRRELVTQFMIEAGLLILLVALLAGSVVLLSQPYLIHMTGASLKETLEYAPGVWLAGLSFLLFGTLLTSFYPAFVLSGFIPLTVLKGSWSRSAKGGALRKGLIMFQFTASALLIAVAFSVHAQLHYVHTKDLGFNPAQTLVVFTPNVRADDAVFAASDRAFRAELLRYPAIQQVTFSSSIPGERIGWMTPRVRRSSSDPSSARAYKTIEIGPGYLEQFGMVLVAGEAIPYDPNNRGASPCFLNEAAVEALGFASPEEAIGSTFISERSNRTDTYEVFAVVRNFHQRSLHEAHEPLILRVADWVESATHYELKVINNNLPETIAHVQALYQTHFPEEAFEHFFLDDFFNAHYEADQRFGDLLSGFSLVAAVVAFLGLFGMTSLTTQQRTKELGIRKVLGASVPHLLGLLLSNSILIVVAGIGIGLPIAYLAVQGWLNGFAFHITIGWSFVLIPSIAVLLIALLAVSYQAIKAALADPVKSLRYD